MAKLITTYTFPDSVRDAAPDPDTCPPTVGLSQISARQEVMAARIGGANLTAIQYEAAKLSIVESGGKAISNADGDIDKLWEQIGAKGRALVMQAYVRLTGTSDEEDAVFLKSAITKTA